MADNTTRICEPWKLDYRFWYVFFTSFSNTFIPNSTGPCLAVVDDFGNLVPTEH